MLKLILVRDFGCDVIEAASGVEALERLRERLARVLESISESNDARVTDAGTGPMPADNSLTVLVPRATPTTAASSPASFRQIVEYWKRRPVPRRCA
ncbi:MAG TPA: hypothetical protein EYQ83_11835 [Acidobacteria bacterium]|nr:hypothetical protein [Acidobacteriota bacterium]